MRLTYIVMYHSVPVERSSVHSVPVQPLVVRQKLAIHTKAKLDSISVVHLVANCGH